MSINRPFLAAFLINSAVLALVLGAAGVVDLCFGSDDFLPVLTIFGSLPGLLIGAGFLAFIFNNLLILRTLGVLLLGFALALWSGALSGLSEQFNQPPDTMSLNLALIGLTFASFRLFRYHWITGLITVVYGIILGAGAMVSIWSAQSSLTAVSNVFEISIFAMMILITPLTMLAANNLTGYDVKKKFLDNWLSIVVIQVITVSLWVYLSTEQIREIYRQGEMSMTQTGESVDGSINYYRNAALRVQNRVAGVPTRYTQRIAQDESFRLWTDFPLIDAVTLVQDGDTHWTTESKTNEDYAHLTGQDYALWISQLDRDINFAADLNTRSPKVIMGLTLTDTPSRIVLMAHLDLRQALGALPESHFDVFSKVIKISDDLYVSAGPDFENAVNVERLINESSVVLNTEYVLPTGNPVTIYALLTEPAALLTPVRIHQIVLISGFIFSIVLTYTFISNARLRRQRSELKQIATQDSVTNLYRRNFLEQQIQNYINNNRMDGHILFVDLDGFKPINDSLGLEVGNRVLNVIASRLIRLADSTTWVSRFSSDEFIMFVEPRNDFDLTAYSQQILKSVREKILVEEFPIYLTASVGVYQLSDAVKNADQAIQRADVAMSAAKESGGNTYRVYTDDMARHYQRALTLRNQLQTALDDGGLEVFYQPLVNAVTGMTESVEALARWPRADGSTISPSVFIPIAERTGQIFQLSEFVMERALRDIVGLSSDYGINVSINLSFQQFYQADFLQTINAVIEKTGFERTKLYFELTESIFAKDVQFITTQLTALREMGIKIAIDDFGTGYSSLSAINRLPFDIIKIDKSFTSEIGDATLGNALVETVINMSHSLDKLIVVEGVETEAQKTYFMRKGCYTHQGYYYAKPLNIGQLTTFLAKQTK